MTKENPLFRQLPLGTRFTYVGGKDVWVVLERHGYGLIAKWEGNDAPPAFQSIYSAEASEEATAELRVVPIADYQEKTR